MHMFRRAIATFFLTAFTLLLSYGSAQEPEFNTTKVVHDYVMEGVELFDLDVRTCPGDPDKTSLCGKTDDLEKFMHQWSQRAIEVGSTLWGGDPILDPWYYADYENPWYAHTEDVYGDPRNSMKILMETDGTYVISSTGAY